MFFLFWPLDEARNQSAVLTFPDPILLSKFFDGAFDLEVSLSDLCVPFLPALFTLRDLLDPAGVVLDLLLGNVRHKLPLVLDTCSPPPFGGAIELPPVLDPCSPPQFGGVVELPPVAATAVA